MRALSRLRDSAAIVESLRRVHQRYPKQLSEHTYGVLRRSLVADLQRLESELGDDHNLVVLGATLRGCRELCPMRPEVRRIERLATRMREPLRRRAFMLGRKLHSRKPRAFARWIRTASTKPHARRAIAA